MISFIVPTIRPSQELLALVADLQNVGNSEVILVNQTGSVIFTEVDKYPTLREFVHENRMPAAIARNLGAKIAKGNYLFFLDDDAAFFSNTYRLVNDVIAARTEVDFFIFDRGYVDQGRFFSDNPAPERFSSFHWWILKFTIEWNICLKRELFEQSGGFPPIGAGSPHAALSGECFGLVSAAWLHGCKFSYHSEVKVSHPRLTAMKSLENCIGYYFGAGYAVGRYLGSYPVFYRTLWYVRTIVAAGRDFLRARVDLLWPLDDIASVKYRFLIARARLAGLTKALIENQRD